MLRDDVARAIWFDHVDQHGYPNGLPTWDELPETNPGLVDFHTREHLRSIADAAIAEIERAQGGGQ